jgi:hypothetical protein
MQVVSNSVDNMTSPGIGPDQATVKINSLRYISFDYNGTQAADPVIMARALCSPLDGSNDNKDFEIDWATGAKMKDFAIVWDGGALSPVGGRTSLSNNSNFALFQKSLKDAGYDPNLWDQKGIGIWAADGIELIVKKVPQPKRDGLSEKNDKGYDKNYYTCLRLVSIPGESSKAGGKAKAKANPAPKPAAATPAQAKASTNGHGSEDVVSVIEQIVKDAGGSTDLQALKMSLFRHAKEAGKPMNECQKLATESATEDFIILQIMEKGLANWNLENGQLTIS